MIACLRRLPSPSPLCTRALSLLAPTKEEKKQWSALYVVDPVETETGSKTRKRWCTDEEQRRNNKLSNATKLLPDALCRAVTKSMLRTDYTSLLSLPDIAMSYWALTFLHVYPIYIRMDQCSAGKYKMQRLRGKFVNIVIEDFLARLKLNKLNLSCRKEFRKNGIYQFQQMSLGLQEGLLSRDEKILTNAVWFTVLHLNCPLHQSLIVTDWLMETLVKLESYSDDEFVELCILSGFEFPLLGASDPQRPAPEALFTYMDAERNAELGLTIDGKRIEEDGRLVQAESYHYHNGPLSGDSWSLDTKSTKK